MEELFNRYPSLVSCQREILSALASLIDMFERGGKLLLCGNGGSCADCEHIVGELMKGFLSNRTLSPVQRKEMRQNCPLIKEEFLEDLQQGLPAISLPSLTALNTAFCNDVNPKLMFAQCVMALGSKKDMLLCISTSGNSKNVCAAAMTAKARGIRTLGLTGSHGGRLKALCDQCICVPETETFKIQELHLPVYHFLCAQIERHFFTAD